MDFVLSGATDVITHFKKYLKKKGSGGPDRSVRVQLQPQPPAENVFLSYYPGLFRHYTVHIRKKQKKIGWTNSRDARRIKDHSTVPLSLKEQQQPRALLALLLMLMLMLIPVLSFSSSPHYIFDSFNSDGDGFQVKIRGIEQAVPDQLFLFPFNHVMTIQSIPG